MHLSGMALQLAAQTELKAVVRQRIGADGAGSRAPSDRNTLRRHAAPGARAGACSAACACVSSSATSPKHSLAAQEKRAARGGTGEDRGGISRRSVRPGPAVALRGARSSRTRSSRSKGPAENCTHDEEPAQRADEAGAGDAGEHEEGAGGHRRHGSRRPVRGRHGQGGDDRPARRQARDHRSVAARRRQGHARRSHRRGRQRRGAQGRSGDAGKDGAALPRGCPCLPDSSCRSEARQWSRWAVSRN